MKRNEFFKTIGLLGLAAALPKFLLGKNESTSWLKEKHKSTSKKYKIHSFLHIDDNGDTHLYTTDNIEKPKHYVRKAGEKDFIFEEIIYPIEYPELPKDFIQEHEFKYRIRFAGKKIIREDEYSDSLRALFNNNPKDNI